MPKEDSTAKKVAEYLLQIKAIKLEPKNPFIWASGWQSPIYCDNRITLSYPHIRRFLSLAIANEIKTKYPKTKAIAGVATGAIGLGMLVAETLDLPFIYVRPEPKKHGRQNQIEGQYDIDAPTVVVEDLISTGKSSLQAIDALRNANINVLGMLALFSYEFDIAEANMKEAAVELTTLSGYNTLIETAIAAGYIEPQQEEVLRQWRKTPANWSPK